MAGVDDKAPLPEELFPMRPSTVLRSSHRTLTRWSRHSASLSPDLELMIRVPTRQYCAKAYGGQKHDLVNASRADARPEAAIQRGIWHRSARLGLGVFVGPVSVLCCRTECLVRSTICRQSSVIGNRCHARQTKRICVYRSRTQTPSTGWATGNMPIGGEGARTR
jgi:hypothetical protein